MLTAMNESGNRICLADFKYQNNLKTLREKEKFYCPTCKEKVILKIGVKKISHFAHYRESTCNKQYENESNYHLAGKQKLYQWLKEMKLEPELEVYDEVIQQRPDIRFIHQQTRYAVEFQCSVIPEELFIKRTKSYQQSNYSPLWILGGNLFSRKSADIISLSDFQYLSIASDNDQSQLPFYCPTSDQFILLKQICPLTTRNALASVNMKAPSNVDLAELLNPQTQFSPKINTWQKEIKKFKLYYSQNPQSYRDPFLKELYSHHLHLAYLPPEIGLPVPHGIYIRTPAVIWQGFIYLDGIHNRASGEIITFYSIFQTFKIRLAKKHITLRTIPLGKGDASIAVLEYLDLLVSFKYLTKINKTTFKVKQGLKSSENMVEQEQKELSFYQSYPFLNNIVKMK